VDFDTFFLYLFGKFLNHKHLKWTKISCSNFTIWNYHFFRGNKILSYVIFLLNSRNQILR